MTTLEDDLAFDEKFWDAVDGVITASTQRPPPPPQPLPSTATTITAAPSSVASSMPCAPVPAPRRQYRGRSGRGRGRGRGGGSYTVYDDDSFSPPPPMLSRHPVETTLVENTQRERERLGFVDRSSVKECEVGRVKEELKRLSKKLTGMEQECLDLRKERDEKEQQIQTILSRFGATDACKRNGTLDVGRFVPEIPAVSVHHANENTLGGQVQSQIKAAHKTIGIQTDEDEDHASLTSKDDMPLDSDLPRRLLPIWSSSKGRSLGKCFIAKLLETCGSELCALFGFSGLNISGMLNTLELQQASHVKSMRSAGLHSSETIEVSKLYAMFAEVKNDTIPLQSLLEVLLDLCSLRNVTVVHRSLQVLHAVLDLLLPTEKSCGRRDNIKLQGLQNGSDAADFLGVREQGLGGVHGVGQAETSNSGLTPHNKEINRASLFDDDNGWDLGAPSMISYADVLRVFKLMLQIAVAMSDGGLVQVEAVAIMNTIVVRSNAYTEREKFGETTVFEAIGVLLKKEAGLCLQEAALRLLYLLLNCPKLLAAFCSGSKDGNTTGAPNTGTKAVSDIVNALNGLATCISCCGNGAQGLHLSRRAIVVLAFLASSGKSGFEILLFTKLSTRANFLGLILRVLLSELDAEASGNCFASAISRERTLLMREALILLNRLASHPTYSPIVLKVLTSGDMASLSIDVANRMSKRSKQFGWNCDDITRQMRESEIVDLARVFKKRIFVFLGESI